ncbi:hypothetical protein C8J57DRAFT_418366 [Mycena rebaudengoi]|nr:hypothetical protein C8J57DRAFT_418366 [Mycena rebaudengoi]
MACPYPGAVCARAPDPRSPHRSRANYAPPGSPCLAPAHASAPTPAAYRLLDHGLLLPLLLVMMRRLLGSAGVDTASSPAPAGAGCVGAGADSDAANTARTRCWWSAAAPRTVGPHTQATVDVRSEEHLLLREHELRAVQAWSAQGRGLLLGLDGGRGGGIGCKGGGWPLGRLCLSREKALAGRVGKMGEGMKEKEDERESMNDVLRRRRPTQPPHAPTCACHRKVKVRQMNSVDGMENDTAAPHQQTLRKGDVRSSRNARSDRHSRPPPSPRRQPTPYHRTTRLRPRKSPSAPRPSRTEAPF